MIKSLLSPITSIFDFVSKPIERWQKSAAQKQEHKFELAKLEQQVKVAEAQSKIKMAEQGQVQDHTLDKIAMEQMSKSWKDELLLIVFILPMILAFIPDYADHALKGFETIKKMPEWYVAIIIGMVVVIYGMRGMLKAWMNKKINIQTRSKGE